MTRFTAANGVTRIPGGKPQLCQPDKHIHRSRAVQHSRQELSGEPCAVQPPAYVVPNKLSWIMTMRSNAPAGPPKYCSAHHYRARKEVLLALAEAEPVDAWCDVLARVEV